ncbi:MAG: galactokinase [Candidatus Portnoybacteria bacterium CG10_big_fil_rev_8_21_14_0_10_44_7]|uniref:Galactokinase n=1 Tax=Candidatus Portnoybacteria bacterium CG10_big_fil_rev_8_21_14_0_10_44_7 TaxID=1974816 RepID=A0A2M8KJE7_9BACT|nr:MAG: galactokinase [Candidatus Portnoybacteria bacterium CG10_big_fil_rev_8_21_14_0_10_44_7]
MIITRTPFRMPVGGGGTDLPSFYKKHGGFIFSASINKYMYVAVNRPFVDKLIRVKYSDSETVKELSELKHELAREALRLKGVMDQIEISSFADIPAGTGMGSSSSYLIGLLKALQELRREAVSMQDLAEEACNIELDILKKPIGKQDQYLAAFGGFCVLEIGKDGKVEVRQARISADLIEELEYKCVLFYTHKQHDTNDILKDQSAQAAVSKSKVEKALLEIKDIGREILNDFEKGETTNYGKLMHRHWQVKKTMSNKISDSFLDEIYDLALKNGAEGGKIMGSGGGGLFLFFAPHGHKELKKAMKNKGLTQLPFNFDFEGSKVLINLFQHVNGKA